MRGKIKNRFSIKKYLLFLAAAALLGLLAISGANGIQKIENGEQLEVLLSKVTYEVEESNQEIEALKKFEPALKHLSQRDQAVYYRALMKLYMLRGDTDHALFNFVDAEIHAEISKAYDVSAWLYTDTAQVYANLDAPSIARDCVKTALEYGAHEPMDAFFYEYTYLLKAEMEVRLGELEEAARSYEQSLEYAKAEDLPEYPSVEQRRNLVMASILLQKDAAKEAGECLEQLTEEIKGLEELPVDFLWFSSVYYPYLTLETEFCLHQGDYEKAAIYMDETFATGFMYGRVVRLMSFTNDVVSFAESVENQELPTELNQKIEENVRRLILEYPDVFQNKNSTAATHIFNANMITIAVFVQRHQKEQLYKQIAVGVAVVIVIILLLLYTIRKTEHKGRIDGLTGAYIRRYFNEVYENLKSGTSEFGVIMYDIDYFKQINDGFGHDAGDWALRATAAMVRGKLDRNSQLFRYGGDEFCIICRKKSLEEMAELAEDIRSTVEQMKWKDGMKVSFSMGAAIASQSPERNVMAKADEKLYESKAAGRNHVSW